MPKLCELLSRECLVKMNRFAYRAIAFRDNSIFSKLFYIFPPFFFFLYIFIIFPPSYVSRFFILFVNFEKANSNDSIVITENALYSLEFLRVYVISSQVKLPGHYRNCDYSSIERTDTESGLWGSQWQPRDNRRWERDFPLIGAAYATRHAESTRNTRDTWTEWSTIHAGLTNDRPVSGEQSRWLQQWLSFEQTRPSPVRLIEQKLIRCSS